MTSCTKIEVAGVAIAIIDTIINFVGIFLSSAVLLYQACSQIKCHIPVTEAIAKEVHRQYSPKQNLLTTPPVVAVNVDEFDERELAEAIETEFWPLVLFVALCFTQIIFNALIIYGVSKDDIQKVKAWLVFKACIVLVGIFLVLTQDSIGQGVYRQISEILYVFLTLFFMCIVFIMYDVMHRRRSRLRNRSSSGRLIHPNS